MFESRWYCEECREVSSDSEILKKKSPFNPDEEITGCPNCLCVNTLVGACDFTGCGLPSSAGAVFDNEYRRLCSHHYHEITNHSKGEDK